MHECWKPDRRWVSPYLSPFNQVSQLHTACFPMPEACASPAPPCFTESGCQSKSGTTAFKKAWSKTVFNQCDIFLFYNLVLSLTLPLHTLYFNISISKLIEKELLIYLSKMIKKYIYSQFSSNCVYFRQNCFSFILWASYLWECWTT